MRHRYLDALALNRRRFVAGLAALALPLRADCTRTSRAVEGPYWRAGAPETNDIRADRKGEVVTVHGVVTGHDCRPLPGALIDVWQADATGKYDIDYGRGETFLRASIRSDARGAYSFRTIRPAPYGVGGSMRPAHIHFIVNAAKHPRLVTQLYFAGDPHLGSDPLRAVHPDLVVTVQGGQARFDIRL